MYFCHSCYFLFIFVLVILVLTLKIILFQLVTIFLCMIIVFNNILGYFFFFSNFVNVLLS